MLKKFYVSTVKSVARFGRKRRRVKRLCGKMLISHTMRRLSLEEEAIIKKSKVRKEVLKTLVEKRLLRSEPRVGSVYYELST